MTIKLEMAGNSLRNIPITKYFNPGVVGWWDSETQVIISCNYGKYFCLGGKRKYFVSDTQIQTQTQGRGRGDVDVIIVS